MLTLNPAALTHLGQESRRLIVCGVVTKADGSVLRCTQFDEDVVITTGPLAGTYLSTAAVSSSDIVGSADLSSDNLEVHGVFAASGAADAFGFTGFTVADVVAGLFRGAIFKLFICQWDAPNAWQKVFRSGQLGQITRTAEGSFVAEWRGLAQYVQQSVGRVYGELCDVIQFTDLRCGLSPATYTYGFTVAAFSTRRNMSITYATALGTPTPLFALGTMKFLSGNNAGYSKQVKTEASGVIELWEPLPFDLAIGDTGTILAGCDRRFVTCQHYANTVNFRGHGFWVPGMPKIIRAPGL